jgi:NADH-quinone oxidoreductase subunit C
MTLPVLAVVFQLDDDSVLKDTAFAGDPALAALHGELSTAVTTAKYDHDELTLTLARESLIPAAKIIQTAGYNFLEDVTCVDWYPSTPRFQVTYHILSLSLKRRLRLVVLLTNDDATIDTLTTLWPSANFYEREVFDLFGVHFTGHPNMRRIMMPEEWQGHPLRKDYPVEGYR